MSRELQTALDAARQSRIIGMMIYPAHLPASVCANDNSAQPTVGRRKRPNQAPAPSAAWRVYALLILFGSMLGLALFSSDYGHRYLEGKAQIEAYLQQQAARP